MREALRECPRAGRFCAALLLVVVLSSTTTSVTAAPALVDSASGEFISAWRAAIGPAADLDRDSDVDLHDFARLQLYATDSSRPLTDRLRECADLNRDGRVDISDLLVFEQATGALGGDAVAQGYPLSPAVVTEPAAASPAPSTRNDITTGRSPALEILGRLPDQPWQKLTVGDLHLAVDLRLSGTDPPPIAVA